MLPRINMQKGTMRNNKRIEWRTLVIKFMIFILILFSLVMSVSALILTGNSQSSINSISYTIDARLLNITDYYNVNTDAFNTTTAINVTNLVHYDCSLSANNSNTIYHSINNTNVGAVILVNQSLNNSLGYGTSILSLGCIYNVNSTQTTTTINQMLNVTNISGNSTISVMSASENKNVVVDNVSPAISLVSPINQIFYIQSGSTNYTVGLNFSVSDISSVNCSVAYTSYPSNNIYYSNMPNVQGVYQSNQNLSAGNYTYNLTCTDSLGNVNSVLSGFQIINNASDNVFFNIGISKPLFGLGEIGYYTISANNNSNVSITVCPIASGWVQCYITPDFINDVFPKTQALPYTNKTGDYLIQGIMKYKNNTVSFNATYVVSNTLTASIGASKTVSGVNDIVTFNATALSGIGTYSYVWTFDDGSTIVGPGAFRNYTSVGNYNVNLYVNDSQGNQYNTSVAVNVRNYYNLNVVVLDSASSSPISAAQVTVNGYGALTDSTGATSYRLLSGSYDVYASKNDYDGYVSSVALGQDTTVYMNLSLQQSSPPQISLLVDNGTEFTKNTVALKFQASADSSLTCSLYIANDNDSWFTLKDSGSGLLINTPYTFNVNDLSLGTYRWKIECVDTLNNDAYSEERTFTVSDSIADAASSPSQSSSDDINRALDNMNSLSGDASQVVDILHVKDDLKTLLDSISRMDKDIYDVTYRRDLNDTQKNILRQNITDNVNTMKYNTPIDVKVTDSKTFVKYARDDAIKSLIDQYISIKNMNVDKNMFIESTKSAQSDAIISTTVRNVVLYYLDGKTKEITLISKQIQATDPSLKSSKSVMFVEVIPKNISQSMSDIVFLNSDYTVLKDDPIIEMPPTTETINYYIDSTIDLKTLQDIDTVIIDKNVNNVKSTTGLAILGLDNISNVQIDGQTIMIVLIILLLLFYLVMHFELIEKLRHMGFGSKKKVTYIKVLINDALDYLEAEDYDKAAYVYREIKLAYEESAEYVKRQVYDESYDLCNKLDMNYANYLLERINSYIIRQNKNAALLEFEKLDKTFNKLGDSYKTKLVDKFNGILNMIRNIGNNDGENGQ